MTWIFCYAEYFQNFMFLKVNHYFGWIKWCVSDIVANRFVHNCIVILDDISWCFLISKIANLILTKHKRKLLTLVNFYVLLIFLHIQTFIFLTICPIIGFQNSFGIYRIGAFLKLYTYYVLLKYNQSTYKKVQCSLRDAS